MTETTIYHRMDEKTYWTRIWAMAATVVIVFIGGCTGTLTYADYKIAQMVNAGADPLAARCALRETSPAVCAVIAARSVK